MQYGLVSGVQQNVDDNQYGGIPMEAKKKRETYL